MPFTLMLSPPLRSFFFRLMRRDAEPPLSCVFDADIITFADLMLLRSMPADTPPLMLPPYYDDAHVAR